MKLGACAFWCVLVLGCAGLLRPAPATTSSTAAASYQATAAGPAEPPQACLDRNRAYIGWTATAEIAAALGGAAGTSAATIAGLGDHEEVLLGLSIGGAVAAALATAAAIVAGDQAQQLVELCGPVLGAGP